MGQETNGVDPLATLLILLALVAAATTGIIIHSRHEWGMLRYRLFRPLESLANLSRPSRVATRLSSGRWGAAFRDALERSRSEFAGEGNAVAAAVLEAVEKNGEALESIAKEVALRAMTEGNLQSALVRLDSALVYFLMFPGRHEDRRTLRRYPTIADGWPAHAASVRAAAGVGKSPMIALLYFLGLDARDGTLVVAYEGDDTRRFPPELAEPPGGALSAPSLTYHFALT
jgi:hypothetical protein